MGGRGASIQLGLTRQLGVKPGYIEPATFVQAVQAVGFKTVQQARIAVHKAVQAPPRRAEKGTGKEIEPVLSPELRQAVNRLPGEIRFQLLQTVPKQGRLVGPAARAAKFKKAPTVVPYQGPSPHAAFTALTIPVTYRVARAVPAMIPQVVGKGKRKRLVFAEPKRQVRVTRTKQVPAVMKPVGRGGALKAVPIEPGEQPTIIRPKIRDFDTVARRTLGLERQAKRAGPSWRKKLTPDERAALRKALQAPRRVHVPGLPGGAVIGGPTPKQLRAQIGSTFVRRRLYDPEGNYIGTEVIRPELAPTMPPGTAPKPGTRGTLGGRPIAPPDRPVPPPKPKRKRRKRK